MCILLFPGVRIPCVASMVPHPRTECHGEFVAVVEAIYNAGNGWRDIPVKGVAPSEGNTDGNHHGAQLSICVSVLRQLSCKFYAGVHYTFFTSSTSPRHLLFAFCDICNIVDTAQQQAYPKAYSSTVKVSSILLPHSRLPTNSKPVKLQQRLLATVALHCITVSRRTKACKTFFSTWSTEHDRTVRQSRRRT